MIFVLGEPSNYALFRSKMVSNSVSNFSKIFYSPEML